MSRVESLISRMTLTEKLGQLTMTACGQAVTGPTIAGDSTEAIKSGAIGNLLNLVGVENVREMQDLAVKESRLGIPLLIGYDAFHLEIFKRFLQAFPQSYLRLPAKQGARLGDVRTAPRGIVLR